jgi:hypothetical protein
MSGLSLCNSNPTHQLDMFTTTLFVLILLIIFYILKYYFV